MKLIIDLACRILTDYFLEFSGDLPDDRVELIEETAKEGLIEWLKGKGFDQQERVLTTIFIAAAACHALGEDFFGSDDHV